MTEEGEPPTKRKRQQPNKKWKEREVLLIIKFLQEEAEFEAPTAQFYYKRFLEKSQLDASWELVRWKVRHLKAQYHKANEWLASTGAALMEHDDRRTIEAKIAKMCPYFEYLKGVFGKRVPAIKLDIEDLSTEDIPSSPPLNATASFDSTPSFDFTTSRVSESSIGQLAAVRAQKVAIEQIKLKFEEKKYERDREIEERKMELEMKKLEMEDKWMRLELEMRERIAKYEIDKKYAHKN